MKLPFILYVLDENASPVVADSVLEWAHWMETDERRRVAVDTVGEYTISTVFIGINMSLMGNRPKLLFETMVFSYDGGGELDLERQRYDTWREAEEGHAAMVERVKQHVAGFVR